MTVNLLHDYDLAIIGGGLAGLTLSIQAADAGFRVIVFEKETYPFHKVCGEYISMESWHFLERCGIPLTEWALPVINQLSVSDCAGRSYAFPLPLGGFGVSRYQLDEALYIKAQEKGVTILQNTKVFDVSHRAGIASIRTNSSTITAKLVVGSFGKRSNLDIRWNRPFARPQKGKLYNYIGVKYHIQYEHADNTIALHNFPNGYCGISKIEKNISCLCYLTTAENLKKHNNSIKQMETDLLATNPQLKKIFTEAVHLYPESLTISQVSFAPKQQIHNHIILLGDAAGMITPLCGNGMSMAMHAAYLCFQQITPFLQGKVGRNEMESNYVLIWRKTFGKRLIAGRIIQKCFGHPLISFIFLKCMHRSPLFARWLIRQTHGSAF